MSGHLSREWPWGKKGNKKGPTHLFLLFGITCEKPVCEH